MANIWRTVRGDHVGVRCDAEILFHKSEVEAALARFKKDEPEEPMPSTDDLFGHAANAATYHHYITEVVALGFGLESREDYLGWCIGELAKAKGGHG